MYPTYKEHILHNYCIHAASAYGTTAPTRATLSCINGSSSALMSWCCKGLLFFVVSLIYHVIHRQRNNRVEIWPSGWFCFVCNSDFSSERTVGYLYTRYHLWLRYAGWWVSQQPNRVQRNKAHRSCCVTNHLHMDAIDVLSGVVVVWLSAAYEGRGRKAAEGLFMYTRT